MGRILPNDFDWISVHGANIKNPAVGYKEKEAAELRDKILNAPNTEELYEIKGTKYYFSSFGDDNNDGLTPETPFKTPELILELPLKEGDAILFERNSVFRLTQTLNIKQGGLTIGSYGEGEKPRIYTAPKDYAVSKYWKLSDRDNIWVADYNLKEACGMFFDHGQEIGALWKKSLDSLKKNYDYHLDKENDKIYLYFDKGDPAESFKSIEITPRVHIFVIHNVPDIVIDNLCLKFTGAFPIVTFGKGERMSVTNCEIGYVGGLWNGVVRFGNAIEFGGRAVDVVVKNNWIYQTFDSAMTWQAMADEKTYKNVLFAENLMEYNNADIEFFTQGDSVADNFVCRDNIMRFTSMGWGTQDEEGGVRWIEGCISAWTAKLDEMGSMNFIDNIMDCPARWVVHWRMKTEHRSSINSKGNKLYIKESYRTSDVAVRGIPDENEPIDIHYLGRTAEEMKESLKRFDETLELEWHNE